MVTSSSNLMLSRFTSPCSFCGKKIAFRKWIKRSERDGSWNHPRCTDYYDAGKTVKQLDKDLKYEREFQRIIREGGAVPEKPKPDLAPRVDVTIERPVDVF